MTERQVVLDEEQNEAFERAAAQVERVRLLGVDTHEIHTVSEDSDEYQRGWREKQFVEHWLLKAREEHDGDFPLLIRTVKGDERGKYGRWLAEVYRLWDGECLNELLKEKFEGVATGE